jgi:type II secretory pathway component PulF
MPTFEYSALDRAGKPKRGSVVSESAASARHQLRQRKLHPTRLQPVSELAKAGGGGMRGMFRGRRRSDVLEFTRQLATMVEADVQLAEALTVLSSQATNPQLNQVVQNVRDQVMAGEGFADSLKQYSGWFDSIFISMVRVGEATGHLGSTLKLLSEYLSKKQRIESKVKSALTYPAILVVVCIIVVIALMTFVVPRLTKIILSTGKDPPVLTQFIMGVSSFLVNYWIYIVMILVVGTVVFYRFIATPKGRYAFDKFMLGFPLFGELIRQSIVARFTSTLAALIRSGLPMADSLQVVSDVTGNAVLTQAVRNARERIMAGADVATPLRESKVIDGPTAHMIAVGERSGELEEMLVSISASVEETTDIRIQRLSAVIEPVIIVIMAVIIGFIVMATVLPILQVSDIS